jgi:hypothetical protein
MEAAPVNTAGLWIWALRMTIARPHTVTNHTNQNNNKKTKHIMPNNNAKSSKSPNSDIVSSPSDNMKQKIINYIRAGYPGLYLVSPEEQRVQVEIKQIAEDLK